MQKKCCNVSCCGILIISASTALHVMPFTLPQSWDAHFSIGAFRILSCGVYNKLHINLSTLQHHCNVFLSHCNSLIWGTLGRNLSFTCGLIYLSVSVCMYLVWFPNTGMNTDGMYRIDKLDNYYWLPIFGKYFAIWSRERI